MTQNMFPFQAAWYEMEVTTATAIKVAIGAERETQQICFIHGLVMYVTVSVSVWWWFTHLQFMVHPPQAAHCIHALCLFHIKVLTQN